MDGDEFGEASVYRFGVPAGCLPGDNTCEVASGMTTGALFISIVAACTI